LTAFRALTKAVAGRRVDDPVGDPRAAHPQAPRHRIPGEEEADAVISSASASQAVLTARFRKGRGVVG
jgi:hypothetical protein